jgi:hypothetical protein
MRAPDKRAMCVPCGRLMVRAVCGVAGVLHRGPLA